MTPDAYRNALEGLTAHQAAQFRSAFGWSADKPIEDIVSEYATGPELEAAERIAVYRLRRVGVTTVATEAERVLAVAEVSADAAKASAEAAKRSASMAGWTVLVALLTTAVTLALARGC